MRRFWKGFLIFAFGGVLGTGVGFALGIFVYPYIFLADVVATESVAGREARVVRARGTFIHADPNDPVHYGKGSATVFAELAHLETDFEVGPGPRFHVYLSPRASIRRNADFDEGASLDLGRLKAFKGSQSYPLPAGTKIEDYKSLVIWCKTFGVLVTPADLQFTAK
ncbi:MAG: hypothetical protein GEU76_00820 [Alphaproteobacteria bacterium]|nr:hypothetical protein [Alphaproteobacteria bacterium]